MQSHSEAALLSHPGDSKVASSIEDDEKDFQEDDADDDFIDEESDAGQNVPKQSLGSATSGKTITLQMLLAAGILEPGNGVMTIEYLGQKFVGDLLEDGKIRSQETDFVFASPSAWAVACKRFINPDKKSGCGWGSVKYKGRKLDAYKNVWYKKKNEDRIKIEKEDSTTTVVDNCKNMTLPMQRIIVKHNTIANRTFTHDANTLIECIPFSNLGKIQPFLVALSTNAALLMDFHCHLTRSEVSGYLAGHWDINTHNLQITHAFPCRNTKADRENAPQVEAEISKTIDREKLTLVGWYHSHPYFAAAPTLRDIDAQLDYQIRMKGTMDNSYTPCIGIIISPYNYENASLESNIIAYWVIPPPETKPNEYGRPMLMSYSVMQDMTLSANFKEEMQKCVDYYKKEPDFIQFTERYAATTTYLEKLKATLCSKFPREQSELALWNSIKEMLGCTKEENDSLLSIPNIAKSSPFGLPPPGGLNSNLMLTSDIASVLFNSGKFPSATSLLGLPDPMAHSTLAANNMFLSTNLFKMQELLKPLSTSSPLPGHSKTDAKMTPLKIPTDLKPSKLDYSADFMMNLKNSQLRSDYSAADFSMKTPKQEYSVSDLSLSSRLPKKTDYQSLDLSKGKSGACERPAKMPKTDYPTLDLSISKNYTQTASSIPSDLSMSTASEGESASVDGEQDKPLNLVADQ